MSQRKPNKLNANHMNINVDALKPGAIHPFLKKRRDTLPVPPSNHSNAKLKRHPKTPPPPRMGSSHTNSVNSLSLIDEPLAAQLRPPPKHIEMKPNGCFDVLSTPPAPPVHVLTSIAKAPINRNTAASTTFTVGGQKITIIGHARTGKTSLRNALFGQQFKDLMFPTVKAPLKPTIVVKPLRLSGMDPDDTDVNVAYEVWDTPGQKVLEYIPPLYITGSFCVMVVYDITDVYSYQRAQYWVTYLEENAKGYDNVVLIGNKYDLSDTERCVSSDEAQCYAEQHGIFFIEISVKTKHNFDGLLAWLNTTTQEKFVREMQMDQEAPVYEPKGGDDGNGRNQTGTESSKKQRKKERTSPSFEEWIKEHSRPNKSIELDKMDVHSRNKNRFNCCQDQ